MTGVRELLGALESSTIASPGTSEPPQRILACMRQLHLLLGGNKDKDAEEPFSDVSDVSETASLADKSDTDGARIQKGSFRKEIGERGLEGRFMKEIRDGGNGRK